MAEIDLNNLEEVNKYVIEKFLGTIAISFVLPFLLAFFINEGIFLYKVIYWLASDIRFWETPKFAFTSLLIFTFPYWYFVWFMYRTFQNLYLKMHDDFLWKWYKEFGVYVSDLLRDGYQNESKKFDLYAIKSWLKEKLSKFPKIIRWGINKLIDRLPLLSVVNSYDVRDLEEGNFDKIAEAVENSLSETVYNEIMSMIPTVVKLVIPINILLILYYLYI